MGSLFSIIIEKISFFKNWLTSNFRRAIVKDRAGNYGNWLLLPASLRESRILERRLFFNENSADSSDSEQGGASDSNSEDTFSGSDTTDNTGDSSDTQTDNTDNSDETTDSSNGDSGGDE